MKYDQIKALDDEKFRRLTGVKRSTFTMMLKVLTEADKLKKAKGGRKNKLSIEDQLLITLEYIREYRTYFHISQSYNISESAAYKAIKWIEDTLIKLPGGIKIVFINKYQPDIKIIAGQVIAMRAAVLPFAVNLRALHQQL